jgi:alpha/beta hydrolase family protein
MRPTTAGAHLRNATFTCLILASLAGGIGGAQAVVPPVPAVEGPITGPGEMHPGIRPGPDGTNLQDFGYVTEEYFVSGTAAGQPYKTRILIRRPPTPQQFSGMVVGEPTHRGGNALICQYARFGIGKRGHGCVTVAARRINLNNPATPGAGLKEFNLERYGSLQVADSQTNEIIAQVGRLLRSNLSGGPMGDYAVGLLILSGTSDSSAATRAYMSSSAQLDHADLRMPDGGPIHQGFFVTSTLGNAIVPITDVPTIQMPSQSEVHDQSSATQGGVLVGVQYRRPDSDAPGNQFRIYEVAGMSHNDARENPAFEGCTHPLSHFPHGALTFMGLQHLLDWSAFGTVPPRAPSYMETSTVLANGTRVVLDEHGNAKGGVRSTYLDVPAFTFTIPNTGPGLCSQTGWITPFSAEEMKALYKNHGGYVSRIQHRLKELMDEGFFPREYADEYPRADIKLAN